MNEIERFKRNLLLLSIKHDEYVQLKENIVITFTGGVDEIFCGFKVSKEGDFIDFFKSNLSIITISLDNYTRVESIKLKKIFFSKVTLNKVLEMCIREEI